VEKYDRAHNQRAQLRRIPSGTKECPPEFLAIQITVGKGKTMEMIQNP